MVNKTLYDFLSETRSDFDTSDTEMDCIITVCYIDKVNDTYDSFCEALYKKVYVVRQIDASRCVVNWSKLLHDNWDAFKDFTDRYWINKYKDADNDEFIYQWLKEINYYIAGYVPSNFYVTLYDFVTKLK